MDLMEVKVTEFGKFYRGTYEGHTAFGRNPYEVLQQLNWKIRGPGADFQGRKKKRKIWTLKEVLNG